MTKLKKCPQCGDTVEFEIDFPLFDGSGRTVKKIVPKRCFCSLKKEEELRQQMELYNRQREVERLRNLSLIDAKAQNVTFASCEKTDGNERALRIARRYVEKFNELKTSGQGIMFYGDVGTGKSYIAAAIANELMAGLHTVVMTSFPNILERALDFDSNSLDFASRAELLVIDDLGAERSTDFALEQMYKVIDDRYRSKRPVILTTNLSLDHMKKCTDIRYSRIFDRLFEMCYPVELTGLSWRKRSAVRQFDEMKKLLGE